MSYAYKIDPKTGEIKDRVYTASSFTCGEDKYIKPRSFAEKWRILRISENAKRLRELDEAIAQEDRRIASCTEEAMLLKLRKGRESKAKERIRLEQFAHAVSEITRITDKAIKSEIVLVTIGEETIRISADEYTGGRFTSLMKELERLDDSFRSDDEAHVKTVLKNLVRIEEDVDRCAEQAYNAFIEFMLRTELAQGVIDRLHNAGWTCTIKAEGSITSPLLLSISDALGNTAQLEFRGNDEIMLFTPGFSDSMREGLQELVLGSLHASGASGAKGRCTDHEIPDNKAKESRNAKKPAAAPVRERMQ